MMSQFLLNLSPFKFLISTDSKLVIDNIKLIYGDRVIAPDAEYPDYHLQIKSSNGLRKYLRPQARFFSDEFEPFKPLKYQQAYAFLEWGMNYAIAANEMQHVIIHSAVLAKGDKAILFPAPPGSGKSTLTSYLCFNGWRLLSDEMAIVKPLSNTVIPFVRPICLKNNSIELAKNWFPDAAFSSLAPDTHKGDVIHLSPPASTWQGLDNEAEIVAIVFPQYKADTYCDIYPLNKTQGFTKFAYNAFNYGVLGENGFHTLTRIIDSVSSYEIFYNNLKEVKNFLEEELIE